MPLHFVRNSMDNSQWTGINSAQKPVDALSYANIFNEVARQRMASGQPSHHVAHLSPVERGEGYGAVMRAHDPRRAKLRPHSCQNNQGRPCTALSDATKHIEGGRIGPV